MSAIDRPLCRKNPHPSWCYSTKMICILPMDHTGPHRYEWIDKERHRKAVADLVAHHPSVRDLFI